MATYLLTQLNEQGVLTLTLNRLDKLNAFNGAFYTELAEAFRLADNNPAVRVVILRGSEHCFSAGNDMTDFMNGMSFSKDQPLVQYMLALLHFSKPVIAAAAGPAIGIGTTMLMHCDLVYLADNTVLRLPFTDLAVVPEYAASLILPRLAGHQRAAELMLLADKFDAQTALEIGLANKVLPADQLFAMAEQSALKLAAKAPASLRNTKKLMKAELINQIEKVIDVELEYFSAALESEESKEAVSAFMQKRTPDFSRFN
ncbi:MAG: enoyl-CoA hydratase/isomerase family protein [Moritella sp.]|uniref:enoyl-CoA hydratase-related protein n=1 Tax=Moritella sp. TaxID=78556 RepID=UPI001D9B2EFA|nr:enoyl-CoA hydratase-related protein [Moritella sp.]NQZ50952.1 enoyl-CoA hydratase/isomerase family protein [Moritella sp.]